MDVPDKGGLGDVLYLDSRTLRILPQTDARGRLFANTAHCHSRNKQANCLSASKRPNIEIECSALLFPIAHFPGSSFGSETSSG